MMLEMVSELMGEMGLNNQVVNILGINFQKLDYETILNLFQNWVGKEKAHQVCIANVHTVVTSLDDPELKTINNNSLVTMDGAPLVWYSNLVHKADVQERICGPDLMLRCLDLGREFGWRHFFLGGEPEVLDKLIANMTEQFPGVEVVGSESPPFRSLSIDEDNALVKMINDSNADFLWVGLGAPKQEKWIASHLDRVNAPVQVGVGAAFDFHSGMIKRAPVWMQKYGLEWLYRLIQAPRLIKRYATTNPRFLLLFLRDFIKTRVLHIR